MLYYSASKNSFFDDAVHGPRTVFVEDEAEQKFLLKALSNAEEDAHEKREAAEDEELIGEWDQRLSEIAEERRLALLNPPLKEVDNPDCRLPEDAIEISAERHAELMAAQGEGKTIRPGTDGLPTIAERVRTQEEVLEAARSQRDKALAATDWTQLPDALDAAKRKLWAAHRKHLRELPARIEEAIATGQSAEAAAELVLRNVAVTRPDFDEAKA